MDGVIWVFLALLVPLIALGTVAGLRRRTLRVDPISGHCSNCRTPMSMRRVSWFGSLLFLPAWECVHCGNRSRSRKGVEGTAR
jgi:hypothetical protein